MPEPLLSHESGTDPEYQALLADSVGLALLVVLDALAPPERLAYVLHDIFDVPFDEIAPILERSPAAVRQLASRARRRVRGAPTPDTDLARQREVVDAFFAAARAGDFDGLLGVLDPGVVARADRVPGQLGASGEIRGASAVAEQALTFSRLGRFVRPARVNGTAGVVVVSDGRPFSVMGFTLRGGKIVEIDVLVDPARLRRLDLSALET